MSAPAVLLNATPQKTLSTAHSRLNLEHHEPVAPGPDVASAIRQLALLRAADGKQDFSSIQIVGVAGRHQINPLRKPTRA
ncbi:MAG: hypothetical protein EON58_07775 [Alphaproteobacteria bacterium]|nr:MAG: hypothetical protein EON58_07775 [Alphaproteobacteria bacterium]